MRLLVLVLGDSPDGCAYASVNLGDTEDGAQLRARARRAASAFGEEDEAAAIEFSDGAAVFFLERFDLDEVLTRKQRKAFEASNFCVLPDDFDEDAYEQIRTELDAVRFTPGRVGWTAVPKYDDATLRTVPISWADLEPFLK